MNAKTILFTFAAVICSGATSASNVHDDLEIPFKLAKGQVLFERYCSSCHGMDLNGSDKGPPLVHPFYKPSHHDDSTFYQAGLKGVKAHHWNFGDMPPVNGISKRKMDHIVPYIRFYQQQKKLY